MKYLKFINEKTIKNMLEEKLNFQVENIIKTDEKCIIEFKGNGYELNQKIQLNDFEAISLNINFDTKFCKKITNMIRNLFYGFFKDNYTKDLENYLLLKENKFIKKLKNKDIEKIFDGFKVLKIKRTEKSIEVVSTNNINKEFFSCFITNFKLINANPKQYKKEFKKVEKNFYSFMVTNFGQKYLSALVLNENKKDEDIKNC